MGCMIRPAFRAVGVLVASLCAAQAGTIEAQYTITLAGLTIGKANLSGALEDKGFALTMNAAFTGLVGAVARGQGAASARGGVLQGNALSDGFSITISSGEKSRVLQISASGGSIRAVAIEPPFEPQPNENRIPVKDQHKIGVVDPLGALVMPSRAADPMDKANCNRKLQVFDGTQRFDVVLSYVGTQQVKSDEGYSGPVLVCAARYVPIAGHRPDRKVLKFMAENRAMDTWLAPVNGGSVLVPYRISVRTMIGTSVIEARRFISAGP